MTNRASLQYIALALSSITTLIGILVLIGWQFDLNILKNVFPNQVTMKPNTAILIIVSGISIITLLRFMRISICRYVVTLASFIIIIVTVLTFTQYFLYSGPNIEQLITSEQGGLLNTVRMSPTTAYCFLCIGISIFLASQKKGFRLKNILIGALSTSVIIFTGSILFSYIPNILFGHFILSSTSMGIHTSLAFIFSASSLLILIYLKNDFIWELKWSVSLGWVIFVILLIYSSDMYSSFIDDIKENTDVVISIQKSLNEINEITIDLAVLENSEYYFLATNDPKHLPRLINYQNAISISIQKISVIHNKIIDQSHINELKNLLKRSIEIRANFIKQYETASITTADTQNELKLLQSYSQIYSELNQMKADINSAFTFYIKQQKTAIYQEVLFSPLRILSLVILLSLGLFTLNADIENKRKSDEMRNRLSAIVSSSNDGIISKDLNGIVTSWNRAAEQIFGYSEAEMIGSSIERLFPPEKISDELEVLKWVAKGEKIDHIETIRKRKDGKVIDVSVTISPLRNDKNEIIGASKIVRDITENKRLEKQLRQSQKMSAIGQLSGGIAHDFNNLLGIIIGNLDLLKRTAAENETILKRVETALRAALRGADLTKRLLSFSRQQLLDAKPTNLNNSVKNLIEMAAQILGKNIQVLTDLAPSLPLVLIDTSELETVLLNLAVNARDAMPNGGKLIISTKTRELDANYTSVQTHEIPKGLYVAISVTDTGQGIPPEIIERVFEPFFTTKERGKGTGMGLSMVYGFAKQSGGTVKIYSEVGHGTTVTIYVPLLETPQQMQAQVTAMENLPMSGKVLIVDDEPDLLEISALYLKEIGYEVYQANDGKSAIELFKKVAGINLLLTDIIMPGGMNGVELAKEIRQMNKDIRVIYLSGFPLETLSGNEAIKIDSYFLRKPYQRDELINIIQQALNNKQ